MFWIQVAAAFAVWIVAGSSVRFLPQFRPNRLRQRPRTARTMHLLLAYLGSVIVLALGGAALMVSNGLGPQGLTILGWITLAIFGSVFMVLQVIGLAYGVSFALDARASELAESRDAAGNQASESTNRSEGGE